MPYKIISVIIMGLLIVISVLFFRLVQVQADNQAIIGLIQKNDIKAVYQIKTDTWKNGVGAGLHYVNKLINTYEEMGIKNNELNIHAVFHGDAGYWMLKHDVYAKEVIDHKVNPNAKLIKSLTEKGVSIELCSKTMESKGWKKEDILDEVKLVYSAYPRIIDLQLQGYAYIRF